MGYGTRTMDWDVAGLAGIGYVEVIGVDVSFFMFRSRTAQVEEAFVSMTAAAGASIGGGQVGAFDAVIQQMRGRILAGSLSYTSIDTLTEFSFWDLHGCLFTIIQTAVTATVGYSDAYITALTWSLGHLFQHQNCSGFIAGVQASAIMSIGTLRSLTFFGRGR